MSSSSDFDSSTEPYDPLTAFAAVDMRVAIITDVEEFPAARRPAWKLTLDVGELGTLRSSAQITRYTREELIGRRVIAVVNLGVRRIAGFKSECLVLAAVDKDGQPHLLSADPGSHPGDRVS